MSEFVFSTADALLADGRWHMRLNRGEAWWADDPLVAAYPQYFSSTPLSVQGTTGRPMPGITPVGALAVRKFTYAVPVDPVLYEENQAVARAAAELVEKAAGGLAEADAEIDTTPDPGLSETVERPLRRGPGRPRKAQS